MTRMALSHSRLNDFQQCPLKFKLKYIDKAPNFKMDDANKSIHLVRGDNIHKALEKYVIQRKSGIAAYDLKSSLKEVRDTVPLIEKYIKTFGLPNTFPESQISVNDQWKQVEWFSKQSYYRAIMDLICLSDSAAFIGDYKTGKFTDYTPPSGYGQLELSAAFALSIYPVDEVVTTYLYVDHKQAVTKKYNQNDRIRIVEHFDALHEEVNAEQNFCPTKNRFCHFCEATKEQCNYAKN